MAAAVFPTILVLFGATGDLAQRKIIPALWQLYRAGRLPKLLQIVGYARRNVTPDEWQARVREIVNEAGAEDQMLAFSRLFVYQSGLFDDRSAFRELAQRLGRQDDAWKTCANKLFYLAVPPEHYQTLFEQLAASGLTELCGPDEGLPAGQAGWTRVIVEKPFGKNLATAQALDETLGKLFREEQIYRIDHYLGKETARNILAFRFSNVFLQPAWDNRTIASVQIRFPETAGIGQRGEFYDGVGALRDVGQNHMLQLLALFLMKHPGAFDAESIRRERTAVLEALEIMDEADVAQHTARGQYAGYRSEPGVARETQTETYFSIATRLNLAQWRGVPIYLRSGKRLAEGAFEVEVQFRHQTPCLCPPGVHYTNVLHYRVQPDEGITLSLWVKKPGADFSIEQQDFTFDYRRTYQADEFVEAYEKLLLDAIQGDQTLFVSTAEIMASWRFIDPIVQAWQRGAVPLTVYEQGAEPVLKASRGAAPTKLIGFVGLGKMGSNMVARLIEHEWKVVATDQDQKVKSKNKKNGVNVVDTAAEVIQQLAAPRVIWIMIPHQVVDSVLEEITPHLQAGDVVIDGGNSFYKDSVRRAQELAARGVHFLDVGVSGGPSGARAGACLMVGGSREAYKRLVGLFGDLSVAGGFDYMGEAGAGHFVKMVHNGIEYGMMQALGEGFSILKAERWGLDMERVASLYNHGSVIESRLVGWLKDAYDTHGPDLAGVTGSVAHSGEGEWTVTAAQELGIPVPVIEQALQFRVDSKGEPSYTGQILSALRNQFGGHTVKNNGD